MYIYINVHVHVIVNIGRLLTVSFHKPDLLSVVLPLPISLGEVWNLEMKYYKTRKFWEYNCKGQIYCAIRPTSCVLSTVGYIHVHVARCFTPFILRSPSHFSLNFWAVIHTCTCIAELSIMDVSVDTNQGVQLQSI